MARSTAPQPPVFSTADCGGSESVALQKDAPDPRAAHERELGEVIAFPEVGGLHHRYERRAA